MMNPRLFLSFAAILILAVPKGSNCFRLSRAADEHAVVPRSSVSEEKINSRSVRPPPVNQHAQMARFIVNQAEWAAIGTISTREDVVSYPMVNLKSVADGALGDGSGIIYMYITPMDFSAKDLDRDSRTSLMMTLAQGSYCKDKGMDPMDPRCPRVILTGRIGKVVDASPEYEFAKSAMFGRHPWLEHVPADHGFYFAKLYIDSVAVLATFGPVVMVPVDDYFNPPTVSP